MPLRWFTIRLLVCGGKRCLCILSMAAGATFTSVVHIRWRVLGVLSWKRQCRRIETSRLTSINHVGVADLAPVEVLFVIELC